MGKFSLLHLKLFIDYIQRNRFPIVAVAHDAYNLEGMVTNASSTHAFLVNLLSVFSAFHPRENAMQMNMANNASFKRRVKTIQSFHTSYNEHRFHHLLQGCLLHHHQVPTLFGLAQYPNFVAKNVILICPSHEKHINFLFCTIMIYLSSAFQIFEPSLSIMSNSICVFADFIEKCERGSIIDIWFLPEPVSTDAGNGEPIFKHSLCAYHGFLLDGARQNCKYFRVCSE